MRLVTFRLGSWPPSPGFEPCAILMFRAPARSREARAPSPGAHARCLLRLSPRLRPRTPGLWAASVTPLSPDPCAASLTPLTPDPCAAWLTPLTPDPSPVTGEG